jgi:hypothetical protein
MRNENEQVFSIADLDDRTRQAVHELQVAIAARYPTTTFELVRGPDDPASIHLLAVADVDDPDEVGDLVVERVVTLQAEEGIPLHVIPLRTPERIHAAIEADRSRTIPRPVRSVRLLGEPV